MKLRWKILLAALVIGVIAIAFLMPSGSYRRELAAYKRELRAKGEKLTIAELMPAPGSKEAIAAGRKFTNAFGALSISLPSMMVPVTPGAAEVHHTRLTTRDMISYDNNRAIFSELQPLLNLSALDLEIDYEKGLWLKFRQLGPAITAEKLAASLAMQNLHSGQFAEAWTNLLAAVGMVRFWGGQPVVNIYRNTTLLARMATQPTWEALQSTNRWTDHQLAELQSRWESFDFIADSENAWAMDRAMVIQALEIGRTNLGEYFLLFEGYTFWPEPPAASQYGRIRNEIRWWYDFNPRMWRWQDSLSYEEELYHLKMATAAKDLSHRLNEKKAFTTEFQAYTNEVATIHQQHADRTNHFSNLTSKFDDFLSGYFEGLTQAEAIRRLTVTAIALERYRAEHGSYPAALETLVPAYLAHVLDDPMDAKPLRYHLKPEGGFLLYAIGKDGVDNGGDDYPLGINSWMDGRDLVWPRPATAEEIEAYEKAQSAATNGTVK